MLSFVLTSLHILTYITYVWQHTVICMVLSAPWGKALFSWNTDSVLGSVLMCQIIDSLEFKNTLKAETCDSSALTQINIFPPEAVSNHADSLVVTAKFLRSLLERIMPPHRHTESKKNYVVYKDWWIYILKIHQAHAFPDAEHCFEEQLMCANNVDNSFALFLCLVIFSKNACFADCRMTFWTKI